MTARLGERNPSDTLGRMKVAVRLFAGAPRARRRSASAIELELPDGRRRSADVWPALELGDEPAGLLFAVNKRYVDRATPCSPTATRWR